MQELRSNTFSTETLVRGVAMLAAQDLSLENDPEYAELCKQRESLLVPSWETT